MPEGGMVARLKLVLALFLPALFIALPVATPVQQHTVSLRERARLANFLRLRDPDARGRTRPRAPSPSPAAT